MDPISMIVGALAAGAAEGLKDTTTTALKDAYADLRGSQCVQVGDRNT